MTLTLEERSRLDVVKSTDRYIDQDLRELAPHIRYCDPLSVLRPEVHLTQQGFEMLPNYSRSEPTGHCDGKVWKTQDWHFERNSKCRVEDGCPVDANKCTNMDHRAYPKVVWEGVWRMREFVEDEETWTVWPRRIVLV